MLRFVRTTDILPALLVLALGLAGFAPSALAETVCIARPGSGFVAPSDGGGAEPRGHLKQRGCYTLLTNSDGQTRLWIPPETGFGGEVVVERSSLAQVLVGDVDLRDAAGEERWGQVLSGAVVAIESDQGDSARVVTVEGRLRARFEVSWDDLFPARSWPEPDPEVTPDAGWPTASDLLPPDGTQITGPERGSGVRAEVRPSLFAVDDILMDPDRGLLRLENKSRQVGQVLVRLVGPSAWVEGRSQDSSWISSRPEGGWDALAALPPPRLVVAGDRQLVDKSVALHVAPKGEEFGELGAGRWVRVKEEDGGWVLISAGFDGGTVEGWVEKKRLIKEKKTPELPAAEPETRFAAIGLGRTAVQWLEPEDHEETELAELSVQPLKERLGEEIELLRLAYARELARDPALHGEVTLRMVVQPSGKVTGLNVAIETLGHPELVAAVTTHFEGLKFAKHSSTAGRKANKDLEVWAQLLFLPLGK